VEAGMTRGNGRRAIRRTLIAALSTTIVGSLFAASAGAAPSASFGAFFSPFAHLGEGSTLSTELTFSGAEYHGETPPLTSLKLHLPVGTVLSSAGFPTCSKAIVEHGFWPEECPEGATDGFMGSFTGAVAFGGKLVAEHGIIQPLFGPGGTLLLAVFGQPIAVEFVIEGHYEPASPPAQPTLALSIPLYETEPSGPDLSLTSLTLELGTMREEAGGAEVSSVTLPSTCTPGGIDWSADAGFDDEPSTPVGIDENDCITEGVRSKATTTLGVSTPTPFEDQAETYTATVQPVGGGPAPTGAITFYDGLVPIESCGVQTLVRSGSAATASCTVSYGDPFEHRIHVLYSGNENYKGSASPTDMISVQEGAAPPEEHHDVTPKLQEAAHHETSPLTGGSGGDGELTPSLATISSAEIAKVLGQQLVLLGKSATITSVLRSGGFTATIHALEAGTATIDWFELPPGATLPRVKAKPVLVASGTVKCAAAGACKLRIQPTRAGRKLLRRAKRIKLTARGTFLPKAAVSTRSATTSTTFTLKR
jgi:Bacterial Ig-like domain (group 3)